MNIERQTVVAHDIPAGLDWVIDFHALLWVGAVPVLFSPELKDSEFTERAARANAAFRTSELSSTYPRPHESPARVGGEHDSEPVSWSLNLPLFNVWTSGTTGSPKLVQVAAHQVIFSAIGAFSRLGISSRDCWLLAMPMHHVGGASIVLRSAIFGCAVEVHETFDAGACNNSIDRGATTVFSAVPRMLERMLDAREDRPFPATLRAIMLGGSATSDSLVERLRVMNAPVSLTWGTSESASHIATNSPGDYSMKLAPIPFVGVREGQRTLRVRGPIAEHGELVTNDRGYVTEGRVRIEGRADRVIISGGENIDLERVAQVFAAKEDLRDVSVVGLASEAWGSRPHLAYVADDPIPDSELQAFGRQRLEGFEVPDSFTFLDTIPRNATGKVDHASLALVLRNHLTPS